MPKPKLSKMEIYSDVLSAIVREQENGEAKPTRVQAQSNLAYDKLALYLDELAGRKMISLDPIRITDRGREFLQDYDRIRDFMTHTGVKYLNTAGESF